MDLAGTSANDRGLLNRINLEVVEVSTFAFKKEQFKIVVAMNHEPIRPLLNGFLEGSHKIQVAGVIPPE